MSTTEQKLLSGRPGHLTPEQESILGQLKTVLEEDGLYTPGPPPSHDDATLLRFLRARKFNLERTRLMFTECEKWRKEHGVDDLYKNFKYTERAKVNKYYPCYYHKTDKDGRPIYIEQLGKIDLNELFKITTEDRMINNLVVEYEKFLRERLPVCSKLKKKHIETSCTIMDLSGVSIYQFYQVKNYVARASAIGQNYYPECMGKFYIINAPYLFKTVWGIVKGFLDEVTVNKISILGTDYYSTLSQQIAPENLPKQFGGLCECQEGCSMSNAGPWREVAEGTLILDSEDSDKGDKKESAQDESRVASRDESSKEPAQAETKE